MGTSYRAIEEQERFSINRASIFPMRHSKKFEFEILEYETRIQAARERWRKVPRLRHIINGLQR